MNSDPNLQILQTLEASMVLLEASRQAWPDMQFGKADEETIETLISDIEVMVPRPASLLFSMLV